MVRRPLLWMLASFILGSLLYQVPMMIGLLAGILGMVLLFLFLIRVSKNRHDIVLLCMPVFFFLGSFLMANQQQPGPMDSYLDGKESVSVSLAGTIHSIQSSANSYKILLEQVQYEETALHSTYVLIYTKEVSGLSIGNMVKVRGELSHFRSPSNQYQFDEASYYKIQNVDYRMYASEISRLKEKRNYLRDGLYRLRVRFLAVFTSIEDEAAGQSLCAMLLGEKALLEEETKELYQVGGIAHIISISGLHVALLGMAVFTLIQKLIGVKAGVVSSIFFIFCYGILTNFSVSSNRAVIMLMLLLAAKLVGKTYDLLSAVSLSALMILFREPMQVYQCGFLLSYGAILGIAVINPCLMAIVDEERLEHGSNWEEKRYSKREKQVRKKFLQLRYYLVKTVALQCAVFLATVPVLLWFYYKIATYAFFLNLLVLPLMAYVVAFGVVGAVAGSLSLAAGKLVLLPAIWIIRFYLMLCNIAKTLPFHYLVPGKPKVWMLAAYGALLLAGGILLYRKYRSGLLFLLFGLALFFLPGSQKDLLITSIDVGQGDCYIVQTPSNHVYMIDGGSTSEDKVGQYRILPYLQGSGITKMQYIFVSHADKDHISGIEELLEAVKKGEFSIGRLLLARTSFQDDNFDSLVAKAAECGVSVGYMECGGNVTDSELVFTCLHPTYDYMPSEANDYSLVLSLTYREFSMLFMGDLTSEAEGELFRNNELMQYDVLKVAHHGSKYSSSKELLEALSPKVALISCGAGNHYGHPHEELLDRLVEKSVRTFITKDSGMITVTTDGDQIVVNEFLAAAG